jgi:hypothetical protein
METGDLTLQAVVLKRGVHETYFIELFSTVVKYGKIQAHVPLNELYIHVFMLKTLLTQPD